MFDGMWFYRDNHTIYRFYCVNFMCIAHQIALTLDDGYVVEIKIIRLAWIIGNKQVNYL